jgi:hypothetical protein
MNKIIVSLATINQNIGKEYTNWKANHDIVKQLFEVSEGRARPKTELKNFDTSKNTNHFYSTLSLKWINT